MGCFYFVILPFTLPFIFLKAVLVFFWEILKFISSSLGVIINNTSTTTSYNKSYSNRKSSRRTASYKDMEFDKEADLWGLSNEDRRIAKDERMSPADFIEAEERDDDELITDEWEDEK